VEALVGAAGVAAPVTPGSQDAVRRRLR